MVFNRPNNGMIIGFFTENYYNRDMRLSPVTGITPPRAAFAFLLGLLLFTVEISFAQNGMPLFSDKYQRGVQFYRASRWHEAAAEFRYAQEIAANTDDLAQALYWIILTELALGDYGSAVRDMDELDKEAPDSPYAKEMVFHRARAYFNQGYFEDALALFQRYGDSIPASDTEAAERKAASYFWIGECLYSMGQYEEAEKFYSWVISRYPTSPKTNISAYRIDIIKEKKVEAELLALLRWSHEESLRTNEDYQRRIRTYEAMLNTYQRRIAELSRGQEYVEIPMPIIEDRPVTASLLDAPQLILPQRGHRISADQLRQQRYINFNWTQVEGASAYILTIIREEDSRRYQIFQSGLLDRVNYTLSELGIFVLDGEYIWQVEAVRAASEGIVEQRGQKGESNFMLNVPPPRVQTGKTGILYGF